jgi:hypothetical protein
VGDPWLYITLTLCHILHSVSHWPVLVYCFNNKNNIYTHTHERLIASIVNWPLLWLC